MFKYNLVFINLTWYHLLDMGFSKLLVETDSAIAVDQFILSNNHLAFKLVKEIKWRRRRRSGS